MTNAVTRPFLCRNGFNSPDANYTDNDEVMGLAHQVKTVNGMRTVSDKSALTTGEVARFCGVNFRTVIRWIERGHLEAYKLPGRGDNRIPVTDFVSFLEKNQMPVPEELLPQRSMLLLWSESRGGELAAIGRCAGWEPLVASSELQLGYLLGVHQSAGVIVDTPAAQESIDRLLVGKNRGLELRIRLCHQPEVEKVCAGWHIVSWPSGQQVLVNLLSEFSPGSSVDNGSV